MKGPWTRSEASPSGQVFEFRVWAVAEEQSRGVLHAFLPVSDRGIDALLHRLSDGTWFRVQAKGRASLFKGQVHLVVPASGLIDDDAQIVSGLLVPGGLGPTMLVVPVRDFKRLAAFTSADGVPVYSTGFGMRPRSNSRWLPWLVPTTRLVERFGIVASEEAVSLEVGPRTTWRSDLGFLGEAEVIRQLAEDSVLNLFRPFPDLETTELAVLHLESRRVLGLQIKTVGVDSAHPDPHVSVLASSFRPAPDVQVVVLAWLREERRFHEECLLIPSDQIPVIAEPRVSHHFEFDWHPGSTARSQLNDYRLPLKQLRSSVAAKID